jgi:outer membrane receptor protein involved in Fe transport
VAGQPTVYECEGNFGNICNDPRPEYKHNVRATWTSGPLTLSTLWRYLSASDDDRIDNEDTPASDLVVDEIKAEHYFDLTAGYQVTEQFNVNFGVRNLFDEKPTRVGDVQEQANTFPETYDVIGRRYFLSGRYKF